jgi:hypothetical protein
MNTEKLDVTPKPRPMPIVDATSIIQAGANT